ncbi:hypothetical protein [Alkalibacillus aidingensis]|uniref:hypothetical protein n=1 Tax=Alkalibacillus aidingensis TaxID=2747607 RepID=UPI0016606651|nr:hypothetical protein [Alkalibacillus aidingensis]
MKTIKFLLYSITLFLILTISPVSQFLESSMVGLMLIQIPGLTLSGYWLGKWLKMNHLVIFKSYNHSGIPGILIAIFTSIYWILPRMVDGALTEPILMVAKYITIPILIGLPIAWSWKSLHSVAKWFIITNGISMLFVMGWLYLNTNIRVCNNFLISQQQLLGNILFYGSISIFLILVLFAFMGPAQLSREKPQL